MQSFNVLRYIKKYQIFIVAVSLLAGGVFYLIMLNKQHYTATAVIRYTNERAEEGLAPDGSDIDITEIYSEEVMSKVFEQMGMEYSEFNLDEFRSRVVVEEVVTPEMEAVQEAKNEVGEVVEEKPTEFSVSFYATRKDSREPEEFSRQVLDHMLDAYIGLYGARHINGEVSSNNISKLDERDYDYLEMIEIIDDSVQGTLENLLNKANNNYYYRSSDSGYSFADLYHEFDSLSKIDINNIYAYILNNRVTKDKEKLLNKYRNRIADFFRKNGTTEDEIKGIQEIIDSYVNMMRESGNTDISSDYILDNVHEGYVQDESNAEQWNPADRMTSYDTLMKDYVRDRESFEAALIDVAYYEYIIEVFEGTEQTGTGVAVNIEEETGIAAETEEGEEEEKEGRPAENTEAAEDNPEEAEEENAEAENLPTVSKVSEKEALEQMDSRMTSLIEGLDELYKKLSVTNSEYNEYAGAANISVMTNVVIEQQYKLMLYAALIIVIFACVMSVLVMVVGRLLDIFEYYIYRDNKYELPNREGCDHYMASFRKLLPDSFSCITFKLSDIQQKNNKFGRDKTDEMIRDFANILKQTFGANDDCFLAVNGIGQFVVFAKETSEEQAEAYAGVIRNAVMDYNRDEECKIEFEYGIAETKKTGIYRIKVLLMNSLYHIKPAEMTE